MLISHEVPLSLLDVSKNFNDYDYCLLHLTYEKDAYKSYYINASKNGRKVLLDNSLFELGDALSSEALAEGVLTIKPTWYVVPDALNNAATTIDRFEEFKRHYSNLPGLAIGVVQGKSLPELVECYRYMSTYADKIAIPFDSVGFECFSSAANALDRWCEGRQHFIEFLVENDIWDNHKPHHLLGCSYAKEFKNPLYKKISIESVDTSNPIVAAISGYLYNGTDGLDHKPSIKLCELIDQPCTDQLLERVLYNTKMFRCMCNG